MSGKPPSRNARIFEPFAIDRVPIDTCTQGDRFGAQFQRPGEFGGGSHVGGSIEVLAHPTHS